MSGGKHPAPGRLALVQDLASTHAYVGHDDDLADVPRARRWLRSHDLDGRRVDLEALRRFRDELRQLIAEPGPAGATWLNERVLECAVGPEVSADLALVRHAAPVATVEATVIAAVVDAIADGTWSRLHLCANAEQCAVAFYDWSRSRAGRWCDAAVCGNRINARAHRRRRRGAPPSPGPGP